MSSSYSSYTSYTNDDHYYDYFNHYSYNKYSIFTVMFYGMIIYMFLERFLNIFLRLIRYCLCCFSSNPPPNHTSSNHINPTHSTEWNIISMLSTLYFAIAGTINYEIYDSCSDINNFHVDSLMVPFGLYLAYIMYDTIFHDLDLPFYFLHLGTSIPLIYIVLDDFTYGLYIGSSLFITEYSTVFLGIIHLTSGHVKTVFSLLFSIVFLIVRPIYLINILYIINKCTNIHDLRYVFIAIMTYLLFFLNIYWFGLIVKKIYEKLFINKS